MPNSCSKNAETLCHLSPKQKWHDARLLRLSTIVTFQLQCKALSKMAIMSECRSHSTVCKMLSQNLQVMEDECASQVEKNLYCLGKDIGQG